MDETFIQAIEVQGQPGWRLSLPQGDSLDVLAHGAHVLSWHAAGRERLYLSPMAVFDGKTAVRGGVPVCFPQFAERGQGLRHGSARVTPWQLISAVLKQGSILAVLRWGGSSDVPSKLAVELRLTLSPGLLDMKLSVHNQDAASFSFGGALHSYLATDEASSAKLEGLEGQGLWNALTGVWDEVPPQINIHAPYDRVLQAATGTLTLQEGRHTLTIQQEGWSETVIWNPGRDARLADLPAGGAARFVCVEAAQVFDPVKLAPGQSWVGVQRLCVNDASGSAC